MAPVPQTIIDLVDTAIEKILNGGAVSSYSVRGRALSKYSFAELLQLRAKFEAIASAEAGGARTYVEFRSPS